MEPGALEVVPACDGGKGGPVELSCRRRPPRRTPRSTRCRHPSSSTSCHDWEASSNARLGHLAAEPDALPQSELLGHALEVGQQVGLRREPRHPVVGLREGEAVELVRHVHPAARVHVLEPGATDLVVLLEDCHVHAGLAEPVGRGQARGPGTDDGTTERTTGVPQVPRRTPRVGAGQPQLLDQERLPLVGGARHRPRTRRRPRRSSVVAARARPTPDAAWARQASAAMRRASSSCSGVRPRPGTSIWDWSGASSGRSSERSPVRCATAHRRGWTSAAAKAASTHARAGMAGLRADGTPVAVVPLVIPTHHREA